MTPRRLSDEQARARLRELDQEEARITGAIDMLTAERTGVRREVAALAEQLRGQLELPLPLASTRRPRRSRAQRAA